MAWGSVNTIAEGGNARLTAVYVRVGRWIWARSQRFLERPWWLQVFVVWLLGRLYSAVLVLLMARQQGPSPWAPPRPGYFAFIDGWDAGWYRRVFTSGYPRVLPVGPTGAVQPNEWAFYPLFPALVKLVNLVCGLPWRYAAPGLATLAGLGACLLLYRLFLDRASAGTTLFAVTLFSFQPTAPILQFGYAESLSLLLLCATLLCLVRGRYLSALPLILLASVCRPIQAPLALLAVVVLVVRWRTHRRDGSPDPDRVRRLVLTVVTGFSVLVWPVVVGVVTGRPDAYFAVESSWKGRGGLVPGELWAVIGRRLFGPVLGLVVPALVVLGAVVVLGSRPARRLGLVLYAWTCAYLLYLLAVISPNGSLFRLLMPAFPLLLSAGFVSRSRAYRTTLLVVSALGQVVWVAWLWQWTGVGLHGAAESNP